MLSARYSFPPIGRGAFLDMYYYLHGGVEFGILLNPPHTSLNPREFSPGLSSYGKVDGPHIIPDNPELIEAIVAVIEEFTPEAANVACTR